MKNEFFAMAMVFMAAMVTLMNAVDTVKIRLEGESGPSAVLKVSLASLFFCVLLFWIRIWWHS